MSKIEDMKGHLKSLEDLVKCAQQNLDYCKPQIEPLRKKIAALEAEAAKPSEWNVYLDDKGDLTNVAGIYGWASFCLKEHKPITVIEKKPVVISPCVADKFYRAFNSDMGFVHQHIRMVKGLKSIGIYAIAADE